MHEKDYLLKFINNLTEAITRILIGIEKNDMAESRLEIDKAYEMFGKKSVFFRSKSLDEIIRHIRHQNDYDLKKLDLLAELIFIESKLEASEEVKCEMLQKAYRLWGYYIKYSREYSFEREQNISFIENYLQKSF